MRPSGWSARRRGRQRGGGRLRAPSAAAGPPVRLPPASLAAAVAEARRLAARKKDDKAKIEKLAEDFDKKLEILDAEVSKARFVAFHILFPDMNSMQQVKWAENLKERHNAFPSPPEVLKNTMKMKSIFGLINTWKK